MRKYLIRIFSVAAPLAITAACFVSQATDQHQARQSKQAAMFAEGVINTDADEYGPAFTPDGKVLYFTKRVNRRDSEFILFSRLENGKWTAPQVAPFSGKHFDKEPFISPDGSKLFFASRRPVAGATPNTNFDLWVVEKTAAGWGEPRHLGNEVNSAGYDNYPAVTADGTLYFGSVRDGGKGRGDLYRSRLVGGKYAKAESLGDQINTAENEADPYIAPDESYMIFSSDRSGGAGEGDLYISFNRKGAWTAPKSLGPQVNTSDYEYTPLVSPDRKHLFFSRGWGEIHQIEMSAIDLKRLKSESL